MEILTIMQTDITIKMDTKYYSNTLVSNMGQYKYHSTNIYEMFSYLKNAKSKWNLYKTSMGVLIYPRVDKGLNNVYKMHDYYLKICTVNLNNDWKNIHKRLLEIVS